MNITDHRIHDFREGQDGGVHRHRVRSPSQRCIRPPAVPPVPLRHFLDSRGQTRRLPLLLQLGVPPASPFLRRGIKVKFDIGIRKDHGSDIAAFHHHPTSVAQLTLQGE